MELSTTQAGGAGPAAVHGITEELAMTEWLGRLRSPGWALSQRGWCPSEKRQGRRQAQRDNPVKTQGGAGVGEPALSTPGQGSRPSAWGRHTLLWSNPPAYGDV